MHQDKAAAHPASLAKLAAATRPKRKQNAKPVAHAARTCQSHRKKTRMHRVRINLFLAISHKSIR